MEDAFSVKRLLGLFFICALLFVLLFLGVPTWQKSAIFLVYWFFTAKWWRQVLITRFDFSASAMRVRLLGALGALMVSGWIIGLTLYFYHFTPLALALGLFVAGLLPVLFWRDFDEKEEIISWFSNNFKILQEFPRHKGGVILYIFLWLISARLLFAIHPVAVAGLVTPWQVLPTAYLYWFGAATFVLGLLCFARLPSKMVLLLLSAHLFLLVSYLPATHSYFYNADLWRHLAQELNLADGNNFATVSVQATNFWQKLDIGQLAYSQFWSFGVMAKAFFNFDLMTFNRWFGPILWSLFFPILAYEWGRALKWKKTESLFLVWLSFLPFGLQIAGATTLPVNIGFLFWLFLMLLVVKRFGGDRWALLFLAILGFFSIFGYSLFFILFWLGLVIFEVLDLRIQIFNFVKHSLIVFSILVVIITIPTIELVTNYSDFDPSINWLGQAQQAAGNFSAYYLASGPRLHDIFTGNILFNQTPGHAFVPNFLTVSRYWLVGFAVLFWLSTFLGAAALARKGNSREKLMSVLLIGLLGAYFVSRYCLAGENLLTRRLDGVLAFLAILVFASAVHRFLILSEPWEMWAEHLLHTGKEAGVLRLAIFVTVFLISGAAMASYSLGPDATTITRDEYGAVKYISSQIKDSEVPCVVGGTYPLLALEAVSAKRVIGGGFSINKNFAQPELSQLFSDFKTRSAVDILTDAKIITNAKNCYAIIKANDAHFGTDLVLIKVGEVVVLRK